MYILLPTIAYNLDKKDREYFKDIVIITILIKEFGPIHKCRCNIQTYKLALELKIRKLHFLISIYFHLSEYTLVKKYFIKVFFYISYVFIVTYMSYPQWTEFVIFNYKNT